MPPKGRPATSWEYQYCDHCDRVLHRSVVWRHKRLPDADAALAAGLPIPPPNPTPNPTPLPTPSSPLQVGDISMTSTEQALSDLHLSDFDDDNAEVLHFALQPHTSQQEPRPEDDAEIEDLSLRYEDMQLEGEEDDQPGEYEGGLVFDTHVIGDNGSFGREDDDGLSGSTSSNEEEGDHLGGRDGLSLSEGLQMGMDLGVDLNAGIQRGLDLCWEGLPGGPESNALDDGDEEEEMVPTAGVNDTEGSSSSRSSTPSNFTLPSSPASSVVPELVRLWDLQAARHRATEGIPIHSDAWMSIKMYKLQMEVNLGANAYQKFRATFDNFELPSLKTLRREMYDLCGIEATLYDCCKNSCMCFVGPYASFDTCMYCHQNRFKPDGRPYNQFHYLPLIPQIKALYAGKTSAKAMRYRSIHEFDNWLEEDGHISDIYDSELYRQLRESQIEVNGHVLPQRYLDDPRDVLLTGLTDGFQLFRRGKHTAWPLLFINNNLSPLERYKAGNCICTGLIPGPRKPKDHDSFMFVIVEDLLRGAVGVDAYDALADEMFCLRVFCPWKCGDMPAAASAYTGGKHHGAQHPCRMCPIEGIRIAGSSNLSHYIPLTRPAGYPPSQFTLATLPLRTHDQWMQQAKAIDEAPTQGERRDLSQLYGINHTAITTRIPGFQLPWSVPYEFLHLLENSIKNYVNLICGDFKDIGPGVESYVIAKPIWKEIGLATVVSNDTIPSAFGRRIPDIAEDRTYFTAEAYLVWATMYSRILLRGRFSNERYYKHWCLFISIIEWCLDFSSTAAERKQLREDIHKWYSEYEKFFYQYNPERLVTCLLTIHAWIHIPDIIEKSGPLWAYWSWVMERFCGQLSRAVSSRKWPYSSLNRRILEIGTLHTIRHMYNLEERLPAYTTMYKSKTFPSYRNEAEYPEITLLHPRKLLDLRSPDLLSLRRRIVKYIVTQYDVSAATADRSIPDLVEQWGRVKIEDADIVNSSCGYPRKEETHRDASFVQYELVIDLQAHRRRADPVFEPTTFFGQLERVLVCQLVPVEDFDVPSYPLVLMDVHMCDTHQDRHGFWEYDNFRYREIINGTSIRALVGRIRDRGKWVLVQRSGAIEHASFVDD